MAVVGYKLGKKLCQVMGLDPKTITSIQIDVPAGGIAKMTIVRYIEEPEINAIVEVIHEMKDEQVECVFMEIPKPEGTRPVMDQYRE